MGAVAQMDGIGANVNTGIILSHSIAEAPVRLRPASPSSKPDSASRKRSRTDRGDTARLLCRRRDPVDEVCIVNPALGSRTSYDDECIDGSANFGDRNCFSKADPAVCLQCTTSTWCGKLNRIPGYSGENLQRAGNIEDLYGRRTDDHDLSHIHSLEAGTRQLTRGQ